MSGEAAGPEPQPEPQAAEPVPKAPAGPRVLRRSREDRVLGGVCGGLGRYLGIDPVLLRLAFALLLFAGGAGALIYVIAWIVIPEEQPGDELGDAPIQTAGGAGTVFGFLLVAIGGVLLIHAAVPGWLGLRYVWPALVIVLGLAIVARGTRK
ncbi:MAG: PspC domain-containing protein [Gaiellaceae bacterium]